MENLRSLLQFFYDRRADLLAKTLEHLWLTGISVFFAILAGLALGILLSRRPKLSRPILGFANVIQTVPSIALLGFMIPLLGIGALPAIIALFLYALLPIIRNTYTGITDVDPAVREAGLGMGMNPWQLLTRVELPLALPVIFAGIRTATVINVGVATLCALIAAGGLGEFIFTGIALNNVQLILIGAIPAALLAIFLDAVLGLIQRDVRRWIKPLIVVLILGILTIAVFRIVEATKAKALKAGVDPEFLERADGWEGLTKTYRLNMPTLQMDAGLMYLAAKNGKVDVITGYTTDGRIKGYDLLVLEDDKHFFPPYYVAPLFNASSLKKYTGLRDAVELMAGKIDNQTMQGLNLLADIDKVAPEKVAKGFLDSLGMKTSVIRTGKADIIIGCKNFTEQYILAELYSILIENYTSLNVELKTGLGGTKICFDALRTGEIDMYPEYTGTGLQVLINPGPEKVQEIIRDKDKVYSFVKEECREKYGLEWLSPIGFNNSYSLCMPGKLAEKLNISSISDLARYTSSK